jgi:mevalonate kinase
MYAEFIVNKDIVLVLSAENAVEEELLKALGKQQNEIHEVRTAITIVTKTLRNGLLIAKASSLPITTKESNAEET